MHHKRNFIVSASPLAFTHKGKEMFESATIKILPECCDLRRPESPTASAWWPP
jgi:hypothetical protein